MFVVAVTLRGEGSVIAACTARNPGCVVEAVFDNAPDRDDAFGALLLVRGATPRVADQLVAALRERYGEAEVLESRPASSVVRCRVPRHAVRSAGARTLLGFAPRFLKAHVRFEGGEIHVRAPARRRAVAESEAAVLRAFLHKDRLAARVEVAEADLLVPVELARHLGPIPAS